MNIKIILFTLLNVALIIYFGASYLYDAKYVIYTKPAIIPIFMLYAFAKNRGKLSQNYSFFVAFFYLGETFLLHHESQPILYVLALTFYFLSYLTIAILAFPYLKNLKLLNYVKTNTIFIFILICCFLGIVISIIFKNISIIYLNLIILLNAIAALILIITALIYLRIEFTKKSIYYFFGSFSIFFSDTISALIVYFLDDIVLNFTERILHFLGFFLIYLFQVQNREIQADNDFA